MICSSFLSASFEVTESSSFGCWISSSTDESMFFFVDYDSGIVTSLLSLSVIRGNGLSHMMKKRAEPTRRRGPIQFTSLAIIMIGQMIVAHDMRIAL